MQGPNFKRLIISKMATDAVSSCGDLASMIGFLSYPEKLGASAKAATEWVNCAIQAVRQAAEPNPWKNASDEEIAGEILRQVEEKKRTVKGETP
jgi:hypothetical protein